jgi:hypothetical protein
MIEGMRSTISRMEEMKDEELEVYRALCDHAEKIPVHDD